MQQMLGSMESPYTFIQLFRLARFISATNELSVKFARDILVDRIRPEAALLTRPWRSAGFTVLKASDVSSVLVELGYISNPREERLLTSTGHRGKMARAVTIAVIEYFTTTQKAAL